MIKINKLKKITPPQSWFFQSDQNDSWWTVLLHPLLGLLSANQHVVQMEALPWLLSFCQQKKKKDSSHVSSYYQQSWGPGRQWPASGWGAEIKGSRRSYPSLLWSSHCLSTQTLTNKDEMEDGACHAQVLVGGRANPRETVIRWVEGNQICLSRVDLMSIVPDTGLLSSRTRNKK